MAILSYIHLRQGFGGCTSAAFGRPHYKLKTTNYKLPSNVYPLPSTIYPPPSNIQHPLYPFHSAYGIL